MTDLASKKTPMDHMMSEVFWSLVIGLVFGLITGKWLGALVLVVILWPSILYGYGRRKAAEPD